VSYLESLKNTIRQARGKPPAPPTVEAPPAPQIFMPEGVDLRALWEEPDSGGGGMAMILSGVAAAFALITLIVVIVK